MPPKPPHHYYFCRSLCSSASGGTQLSLSHAKIKGRKKKQPNPKKQELGNVTPTKSWLFRGPKGCTYSEPNAFKLHGCAQHTQAHLRQPSYWKSLKKQFKTGKMKLFMCSRKKLYYYLLIICVSLVKIISLLGNLKG